jgi:hypothetical protein
MNRQSSRRSSPGASERQFVAEPERAQEENNRAGKGYHERMKEKPKAVV